MLCQGLYFSTTFEVHFQLSYVVSITSERQSGSSSADSNCWSCRSSVMSRKVICVTLSSSVSWAVVRAPTSHTRKSDRLAASRHVVSRSRSGSRCSSSNSSFVNSERMKLLLMVFKLISSKRSCRRLTEKHRLAGKFPSRSQILGRQLSLRGVSYQQNNVSC